MRCACPAPVPCYCHCPGLASGMELPCPVSRPVPSPTGSSHDTQAIIEDNLEPLEDATVYIRNSPLCLALLGLACLSPSLLNPVQSSLAQSADTIVVPMLLVALVEIYFPSNLRTLLSLDLVRPRACRRRRRRQSRSSMEATTLSAKSRGLSGCSIDSIDSMHCQHFHS